MKFKTLVAAVMIVCANGAHAGGLGISSAVYAERFNRAAQAGKADIRVRSEKAEVQRGKDSTVVTIPLDPRTRIQFGYGSDPKKLTSVMLYRTLTKDLGDAAEALVAAILTAQAAYENPVRLKVAEKILELCQTAFDQEGRAAGADIGAGHIECQVAGSVLMVRAF